MRIMTKRAYASLKFRTYDCVRRWIKAGRISPAALVPVPYGRKQIGIWVERADADLAQNLSPGQQRAQAFPIKTGVPALAFVAALFLAAPGRANAADCSAGGFVQAQGGYYKVTDHSGPYALDGDCTPALINGGLSGLVANPPSTLAMTPATAAYSAGQLIANSATAAAIVNPSFSLGSPGSAAIPRVRLTNNDAAWDRVTVQVDLWNVSPTWVNGDRAAWFPATGTGGHLASYSCAMTAGGDGSFAECALISGALAIVKLPAGTNIFWSMQAVTASGVMGASKTWTLTPELIH
jgi:hypothetical protein